MLEPMVDAGAGVAPWRVAITRADEAIVRALGARGFEPSALAVLVEGPPPEPQRLLDLARTLDQFDWVMCASARSVRTLSEARGARWPASVRTAAVGAVTASAIVEAGGMEPIVGDEFNAGALWERLRGIGDWSKRRVLVTTVAGGRRELIEALQAAGATVTEVEGYSMLTNPADRIRQDWQRIDPHAAIIGSAATARHLVDAVGAEALTSLKAVVAIGPTTADALAERKIGSTMPAHATFLSAVEHLTALRGRDRSRG